jgi:WD40 repeat protein
MDHSLYQWAVNHPEEPPVRVGSHERAVGACAFSRKGTLAISGCGRSSDFDGVGAKVWVLLTGECVPLIGHSRGVSAVTFSPDSQFAVTASMDRSIRTWNAMTGGVVASMTDPGLGPVSAGGCGLSAMF